MEKYRSRDYALILYQDDITHEKALKKIMAEYDHAGVCHNRDIEQEEPLESKLEFLEGFEQHPTDADRQVKYKKPHYHIILKFRNAKWNTSLAEELGIAPNYMEPIKNFDNAMLYLLHYNNTEKAQYDIEEVFGNLKTRLNEIISKKEKSEGEKVVELIQFIKTFEGKLTITLFAKWCAENGYWAEFRRSGAIFCKIIEEHNEKYIEKQR